MDLIFIVYNLLPMITEQQKYKAYILSLAGFALMTPFGKLWVDFYEIIKALGVKGFAAYVLVCICLFGAGLTFIEHGRSMLIEKRKS